MKKIIIVGGGAAGMFAAVSAANEHTEVHIYEHNEKLGKKLFITGKIQPLHKLRCHRTRVHLFNTDASLGNDCLIKTAHTRHRHSQMTHCMNQFLALLFRHIMHDHVRINLRKSDNHRVKE